MNHATRHLEDPTQAPPPMRGDAGDLAAALSAMLREGSGERQAVEDAARLIEDWSGSPRLVIEGRFDGEPLVCRMGDTTGLLGGWDEAMVRVKRAVNDSGTAQGAAYACEGSASQCVVGAIPLPGAWGIADGMLSLLLPCGSESEGRARWDELRAAVSGAERPARDATVASRPSADTLMARVMRATRFEEAATVLTSGVRWALDCDVVALGSCGGRRLAPSVRLERVAGVTEANRRGSAVGQIVQAMLECTDLDRTIVCGGESQGAEFRVHHQWSRTSGLASVASVPMRVGGAIVGVLSVRRPCGHDFTAEEVVWLESIAGRAGPALRLLARAERSLAGHVLESGAALVTSGPRGMRVFRAVALVTGVALVGWLIFGGLTYTMTAPAMVAAVDERVVAAPRSGRIESVLVAEGARVVMGQPLVRFETTDLELELNRLVAESAVQSVEMERAMGVGKLAEAGIASARRDAARAQMASVRREIERSTVRAPIDAVVTSSGLDRRAGAYVALGETLIELADDRRWEITVDVPGWASLEVEPQMAGVFRTRVRPEEGVAFRIGRLGPTGTPKDGRMVFRAHGGVEGVDASSWFRPGLEGLATVEVGRRPAWRVIAAPILHLLGRQP